jgi:hypothetical protein
MIRRHDQAMEDRVDDLDRLLEIENDVAEAREAVSKEARDVWALSQIWVRYSWVQHPCPRYGGRELQAVKYGAAAVISCARA